MTRLEEWSEGQRVVVVEMREERAGTITVLGRVMHTIKLDGSGSIVHRYKHEIFDEFNDGRQP